MLIVAGLRREPSQRAPRLEPAWTLACVMWNLMSHMSQRGAAPRTCVAQTSFCAAEQNDGRYQRAPRLKSAWDAAPPSPESTTAKDAEQVMPPPRMWV